MVDRPHLSFISTGGTIAVSDEAEVVPRMTADELVESVPGLGDLATVSAETAFTKPSPDVTLSDMVDLLVRVRDADRDPAVDGVVVTHGTDTLEESAYFVDLCYGGETPVVFTGAMRRPTLPNPDGPANVLAAARFALAPALANHGVLVSLADAAYTARDGTKAHANAVDAFRAPQSGPVARVVEGRVTPLAGPVRRDPLLDVDPTALTPDVVILTAAAATTPRLTRAAVDADGVVLAGMGAGHVPTTLIDHLRAVVDGGVPLVVTSRSPAGEPYRGSYDFGGGESTFAELGAHFSDLSPWKARIKLAVGLASPTPVDDVFADR